MMMNLFSIFDPSSSFASMNWLMMATPVILLSNKISFKSKMNLIFKSIDNFISKELNPMLSTSKKNSSVKMMKSIFLLIMMFNLLSLLPHNFTITSQMSFGFPMAFSMWVSFLILGWTKKTKDMMAHLLPSGTPNILMPIMILIEVISQIIRPITLSVRLCANMVAGHLLLSLLSSLSMKTKTLFLSIIPISMALCFLEMCVSMIQAYVFMTLLTLYSTEVN